ncbi:unnamed protein product [Blepharisma stoltei]|uniref:Transmembrane protein n=1 Tax=Blepharisma stoltei TaxID=1481888 RepID=A0AAU9K3A2_9CILI|nr:unnamed protein product [Blepharisma stoltei]
MSDTETRTERKRQIEDIVAAFISTLFVLAFIIAIIVVLAEDVDKNCDNPIREWLIVWAIFSGLVAGANLALQAACNRTEKETPWVRWTFAAFFGIAFLFTVAWMITGSVWLYTSDDCYDDYYDAWALTLAILIVQYVFVGLALVGFLCLLTCFSLLKKRGEADKENKGQGAQENNNEA